MATHTLSAGTYFMQGSEACGEAAIMAGCRFFAGYPITPASEILEYLAKRLPQTGGVVMQMEDEMASLAAVIGASWTGNKAMTATSGPGFSLMQENLGYAFMTETPCVVVNVQRVGPSTGQATKCAQGDVMQSRWGTHGDYASIVLSPNSVQEMFDLTIRAFNLAEQYRVPVVLLADEIIAHMREQVTIPKPENVKIVNRRKPKCKDEKFFGSVEVPPMPSVGEGFNIAVTGSTHDAYGIRFTANADVHRQLIKRLVGKIERNIYKIADYETSNLEDCDVGVVTFGCTSRAIYETAGLIRKHKVKLGFVRLKTLWPFPEKIIQRMARHARLIVVPEMNLKQLFYEVQRAVNGVVPVSAVSKVGGGEMIMPEELVNEILRRLNKN